MYFLGIDTSTTSSKALLIDERGKVIAVASSPHTLQTPKPLWSEQDPREWWDAELVTVNTTEGAAYGAALLAGVGAGAWRDVASACRDCIRITGSTLPDEKEAETYRRSYAVYRELYPALKGSFEKMGGLD